ncbi:hypothetical protein OG898_28020 [Streptomyces sp. NBC_00193]|uniref:hypothetical protein n=1 Tax=Streptomyces sp. NBC_00193 TaxID=2975675 RepID=UPI00224F4839|nr:hypothetical protein [Streptomyces sp. NBC_00193]MCX5300288.1 hypothetical protein [Streptomyces sp. NBC_00193]
MPESDKPTSDGFQDDGRPPVRDESRTARERMIDGVAQAFMAGVAGDAAHWFTQGVAWLYETLVSHL